jgi:OOP family OmpA-OmpF porin
MNNWNVRLGAALLCVGCGLAATAQAAEEGWYVVGFGGQTSVDSASQGEIDQAVEAVFNSVGFTVVDATSSLDDSDTGFGLGVGYQVNTWFGAELYYVDLGSLSYNASGTVNSAGTGDVPATFAFENSAQGPVLSLLGFLPIGEHFAAYLRAGVAFMDVEYEENATIDGVPGSFSDSTQRSNGVYGIGGEYSFNRNFALRLEWDRYADVGSEEVTGEADVDLLSLALRYNFH